jgi:hypothetical protein
MKKIFFVLSATSFFLLFGCVGATVDSAAGRRSERLADHARDCSGEAHGTVKSGFLNPTTSKGFPCTPATRTCVDGVWSGPEIYPTCTEL